MACRSFHLRAAGGCGGALARIAHRLDQRQGRAGPVVEVEAIGIGGLRLGGHVLGLRLHRLEVRGRYGSGHRCVRGFDQPLKIGEGALIEGVAHGGKLGLSLSLGGLRLAAGRGGGSLHGELAGQFLDITVDLIEGIRAARAEDFLFQRLAPARQAAPGAGAESGGDGDFGQFRQRHLAPGLQFLIPGIRHIRHGPGLDGIKPFGPLADGRVVGKRIRGIGHVSPQHNKGAALGKCAKICAA